MQLVPKFISNLIKPKYYNHVVSPTIDASSSMQAGVFNRDINSDYENIYPSAQKAEQAFAKIRPYAIDERGERITRPPKAFQSLYRPNTAMSGYRFRRALAGQFLTKDEILIRVHFEGEQPTADNIYGYTFIENVIPQVQGGKRYYHTNYGIFSSDEVLALPSGVNPFYVTSGFSAARAARRWTTLDDYIADYQSAFFRNGAIPAGQFVITAPTNKEYQDIKRKMKEAHQGAEKSNNVIYSHRPTDENGQPNAPTVEWVGYNQQNKDLAIKELVDATRNRVDSTMGVPKQIAGQIEDSHYNGVRLAEYVTTEYVARPMAMEIYDTFIHELNRITGGVGFGIDFKLETPVVEDEELVRARKKQVEIDTISRLQLAGYSLDSIVSALKLDKSYEKLEKEPEPTIDEDVVDNQEDLPEQDPEILQGKTATKQIEAKVTRETEDEPEDAQWQRQVKEVAQTEIDRHVDSIIADLPNILERSAKSKRVEMKQVDADDEEVENFRNALLATLLVILAIRGQREYDRGVGMVLDAGFSAEGTASWVTSDAIQQRYSTYLNKVANSYTSETAESARRVLAQGRAEGLSLSEMRGRLNEMKDLNGYRAERLARTEIHRTQGRSSVEAMMQIKDETGLTIEKIWRVAGPDPCEFCIAMDGTTLDVDQPFIAEGQTIRGADGGEFTNDFDESLSAQTHPNCECRQEYKITRQ